MKVKAYLLLTRFFFFYIIVSISQSINKRACRIHKLPTFPFREHTQQRLLFAFCKAEVSMLIKCILNTAFQKTVALSASSSVGSSMSRVLGIM